MFQWTALASQSTYPRKMSGSASDGADHAYKLGRSRVAIEEHSESNANAPKLLYKIGHRKQKGTGGQLIG